MLKRTPLYEEHKNLNAKIVDFGGWELPVSYTSIIEEHLATREKAGIFDVSHMGEILVKGKNAKKYLNLLLTNDLNTMYPKKVIYTLMTNEKGTVVDDLLVYMVSDEEFFLVVNASNSDKDFNWIKSKLNELDEKLEVINQSSEYGQIALQGPQAENILQKLTDYDLSKITFFTFDNIDINGKNMLVSRTGYTGEDGFEIYCSNSQIVSVWNELLSVGKEFGLLPVGLGARDTLRFEAALPLYGHEISDNITPIEAGLKFFVKLNKENFFGKEIIANQVENGVTKKLVGLELIEKGIPRDGYKVEIDGNDIGYITSGTHSPTFKKGLAMAMISIECAILDAEVDVIIRNKKVKGKIVKLPFYKKKTKK